MFSQAARFSVTASNSQYANTPSPISVPASENFTVPRFAFLTNAYSPTVSAADKSNARRLSSINA